MTRRIGQPPAVALACALFVAFAVIFLDRPWADFAHASLRQAPFVWLTHLAEPAVPLTVVGLIGIGAAAALGKTMGPIARALLTCCISVAIAYILKEQLKFAVGRTWPETWTQNNPSWIGGKIFEIQPFHGGRGWASFPSGHMAVIAAPMTVAAHIWPVMRRPAMLVVGLVAVGLLGANYHWPSDVVAGTFLGWASGIGALRLTCARQ